MMKEKRTTSRHRLEQMVAGLRHDIEIGSLKDGDFLPSELDLSKQYQLSKNTVRKGLDSLVMQGLLEKMPRIGARVTRTPVFAGHAGTAKRPIVRFGYYHSLEKETRILELVDRFHALHPDIQVQPIPVTFPRDTAMLEKCLLDRTFDVMTFNLFDYEYLYADGAEQRCLEPAEASDGIYPFLHAPFRQSGRQYVQPFVFTPVVLLYNKEHFRDLKIAEPDSSWTWAHLLDISDKLAAGKDALGFYYHLMSDNRWPIFLLQSGVRFERNAQGRYTFTSPVVRDAVAACTATTKEHVFLSENDADAESLFLNQKASMIIATYSTLNSLKLANFEYDVAPLPHLGDPRTLLVIIGLAVNRLSECREAAQRFADYLLSEDAQLFIRQQTLSLPAMKLAAEWIGEEPLKRPYRFHMYREIAHTFRLYTELGLTCHELGQLRDELRYYWAKMDDLDTVLERLEATV